jgi:hypothetical protein
MGGFFILAFPEWFGGSAVRQTLVSGNGKALPLMNSDRADSR